MKRLKLFSLFILTLFLFGCSSSKSEIKSMDLSGKSVKELMGLNKPIECDVLNLLDKAKKERSDIGIEVPTKLWINGNNIKEKGISIFTDGSERETENLIVNRKVYSRSLITDNTIALSDELYQVILDSYTEIESTNLKCKFSLFSNEIFVPKNVCYIPGFGNPECPEFLNTN